MVRLDVTQNDSCVSTYGLEVLLELGVERTRLESNDLGSSIGVMGNREPHSGQKIRWTSKPEDPLLEYFLAGPLMVSFSLGTTVTRAAAG